MASLFGIRVGNRKRKGGSNLYTEEAAKDRARTTRDLVLARGIDQVLVVPTEPLARLATTQPREGLIDSTTVAVANYALWRVHAFNQLVMQLADFNATHAAEITSADTDNDRREDIAVAAMSLSFFVHWDGIGLAWAAGPNGRDGWYRALVTAVSQNLGDLMRLQISGRWRWLREWPYVVVDVLAAAGLIAVIATVAV